MNRLVIVGNGFDLAHGAKTGYEDFLLDYFIQILTRGLDYDDPLIKVKINNERDDFIPKDWRQYQNLKELLNSSRLKVWEKPNYVVPQSREVQFIVTFKSQFFERVTKASEGKWTDIERAYITILLEYCSPKGIIYTDAVKQLNLEFDYIKSKLFNYIAGLDFEAENRIEKNKMFDALDSCFEKTKSSSHISKIIVPSVDFDKPEKVYFLNFNYTSLLLSYLMLLDRDKKGRMIYLPIHGSINDINSIIFGYGDETHEHYKFLENEDEEELLKNIKSFYYPEKAYYQELMDFIKADVFDVYVIGHSLGLSDRVLLKTIFESDQCKAIKLFHRGTEQSQFRKRIALSRHFGDKIAMRNKVLNYDESDVFGGWESINY